MSAELQVSGFDDLFKTMDALSEEIGKGKTDRIWRDSLALAMKVVLDAAKAAAPKDSGQLAEHIYMKVHRPKQRDKDGKYYDGEMYLARVTASPIRDDTQADIVLNKRGKFQTVYRGKKPVAVSQEFGNARTAPQPFLRVSLSNNEKNVMSTLETVLRIKIDEIARAKARKGSS